MQQLTDDEKAMLELERSWWQSWGVKEQVIRERFGLSTTQYYIRLNRLIDRRESMVFDPLGVKRLQRLRADRQRTRERAIDLHPSSQPPRPLRPVPDPA